MPGEKKKVNLVNLKTNFGQFLYKWYACQNCYSIDRLAFGFNCAHRFCSECNDNFRDQCKECKANIENVDQDNLQTKMFLSIEDLKDIMSVDMKKIANKMKQKQSNEQAAKSTKEASKKVVDKKNENAKSDKEESDKETADKEESDKDKTDRKKTDKKKADKKKTDKKKTDKVDDDVNKEEDANSDEEENQNEERQTERSSRRQVKEKSVKKSNESKKINSSTSKKQIATKNKSTKNEDEIEDEEVTSNQSKQTKRTRESSRTKTVEPQKTLTEIIKESTTEAVPNEESVARTSRKAEKSTRAQAAPMVIISTSITDAEISNLKKFAKKFNARLVTDFSDEVTHLVTLEASPNLTTRTLKYLKSLLAHKWLLKFDWINKSVENNKLEDECDYELLGITKQTKENLGAPKRSRENASVNLFEGKQFYIDGKFGPKSGLPKNDYRDLIKLGGGEILESEKDVQDGTYIIIDLATMPKSKYKDRKNAISTTDFLNSVSNFKMF